MTRDISNRYISEVKNGNTEGADWEGHGTEWTYKSSTPQYDLILPNGANPVFMTDKLILHEELSQDLVRNA